MPYINKEDRKSLDLHIDLLANKICHLIKNDSDTAFAGLLNYTCTRLTLKIVEDNFGGWRYWLIAIVTGIFKNIADEFYSRIGFQYEQKQIEKNGDVDLYQSMIEKIENS